MGGGCSDFGGGWGHCRLLAAAQALPVSSGRARQLRWVVGELHRWHPEEPECTALVAGDLADYLAQAQQGRFRSRAPSGPPASTAADRVRRACLKRLAAAAGTAATWTAPSAAPPRSADPHAVRSLLSWAQRVTGPGPLRSAAVAHLAAAGLRVGEIATLRLDQVTPSELREVTRTQPGPGPTWTEDVPLTPAAHQAVTRWLEAREPLVRTATEQALFLTLTGAHTTQGPHGAGYRVSARSLDREHRHLVAAFLTEHNPRAVRPSAAAELTLTRIAASSSTGSAGT